MTHHQNALNFLLLARFRFERTENEPVVSDTVLLPSYKHTIHSDRRETKAVVYWVSEAGGMRTPPGLRPTWSTRRLFEAFSLSPSSSHQGMSEGHVWTFEAGWDGMGWAGGRRVQMRAGKKGAFPSHRPVRQMSHSFISSACFTSQCKCGRMKLRLVQKNKGTLGMFHSVRKHAEHRTLNTYTQQLVLSKCRFF